AVSDTKTYDGGTTDSATPSFQVAGAPTANALLGTDKFTALSQSFTSKDVLGSDKSTLQVSDAVNDGNNGADYTVTTNTASGTINAAGLTINAVSDSKTYDGTTSDSATPMFQVAGHAPGALLGTDKFTSLGQAFQSAHVLGAGKSTL